jgi:hypothetical protein
MPLFANGSDGGAGRSLLDEIVRDGARQMLVAALQAEVAVYVEQLADQLDGSGRRLVVRNGYHQPRDVLTRGSTTNVLTQIPVSGSGSPRRSCRLGHASPRR